jgi:Tfp pilus assembly protein PilF/2-polyprenyl-3-methyl-5-hydroxy-6-metoxy-1,4-benzoquinol methylase
MRKAAALLPGDAEVHSNLGLVLKDLGLVDGAVASYRQALKIKPDFAAAHNNLGNALQSMGRLDEAEASYRRALKIKPDYAEAYNNLGNALQSMGQMDESEASYLQALKIKPDYAEAHNNLGNTLQSLGRLDESEASYRRALEINPDYTEAHNNLGNAFLSLGRLGESEASCLRALKIKPDFAEAYNNLGNALQGLGRLGESETSYLRALKIKPDYPEALNNLALLLNAQGKATTALHVIKQSLRIKETAEARNVFVSCVKHIRLKRDDNDIRIDVTRALVEPWCRPDDLARISIDLVRLNPEIEGCIVRAAAAWPLRLPAQDLFGPNGLAMLAADTLLCALLVSAPVCDLDLERFLTMARRAMLQAAAGMTASDAEIGTALSFYSALARQCFINEYVFSYTNDEIREAGNLRDALVAALEAGTQSPSLWPVAVAAYFPLYSLPHAARLLDTEWPADVAAVLAQQVREPTEELQERTRVPRMTDIENAVSLSVQNQYEENPYPRWVKAEPAGNVKDFVGYLCRKFPLSSFRRYGKSGGADVMIAGCGTGRHSIEVARHFQCAQVLAVDLSISSLSYARRKTRELGLTSIEYAQADLLKLGSLDRSFDVVESVGVLHHLADPWAGWRVLLSLLRPAGFMKLGFYSEVARRHIVKARAFIAGQGYGATADDIRRCRQDLTVSGKCLDFGNVLKSSDFFTISTCRDLLFHVQEHHITLTAIDAFLRDNQLTFLGFEIGDGVLNEYKLRFPDNPAATNLGQWQMFEREMPDTFFGMYQFWIQKAG